MPFYFHLPCYYPNFDYPLHTPAYLGDTDALKKALSSSNVCVYQTASGYTALGVALAQNRDPADIMEIYKHDIMAIKSSDNNSELPVLVAFGKKQVKKFKNLSTRTSAQSSMKNLTVLLKETNHTRDVVHIKPTDIGEVLEFVQELRPNGYLDVNQQMKSDKISVNFVHLAAMNGMQHILIQLIDFGADLQLDCIGNPTPIHFAIANGKLETVKFLFQQIADNHLDRFESQLIDEAVDNNEYNVFEFLVELFVAKKQERQQIPRAEALRLIMPDVEKCFHYLEFASKLFENKDYMDALDLSNMLHRCALNATFTELGMKLINMNFDWLLVERDDNYLQQPVSAFHMIVSQGWTEIERIYEQYPAAKKILFQNPDAACQAIDYGFSLNQIPVSLAEFLFATHKAEIIELNLISPLLASATKRSEFGKIVDLLMEFAGDSSDDHHFLKPLHTSMIYRKYDVVIRLLDAMKSCEAIAGVRDENGNNLLYYTMWEKARRQSRYGWCCQPPRGTAEERELKRDHKKQQLNAIFERLLELGVAHLHRNNDNQTLLHRAVLAGDAGSVRKLIDLGVPIDAVDEHGVAAIHRVLNIDILRILVTSSSASIMNVKDENGDTVLHYVVKELDCEPEFLAQLIEYGVNVNAQNKAGRTALFCVSSDECAAVLLEHGANANVRDCNDSLCVDVLQLNQQPIKGIVEHSCLNTTVTDKDGNGLSYSMEYPDLFSSPSDPLKELVNRQCNALDVNGSPMLCVGLFYRNENGVRMLLNEPAIDVSATDQRGQQAMHLTYNCPDIITILLEKGANINALDNMEQTPLMHAIECKCDEATGILLNAGAELNVKNSNGDTVLHFAARANNFNVMMDIIGTGGDWSIKNQENKDAFDVFGDVAASKIVKSIL